MALSCVVLILRAIRSKLVVRLSDRRGVSFPVRMRYGHRSIIFNSVPTYMADRRGELSRAGVTAEHFVFSTESKKDAAEIIKAYKNQTSPASNAIKRIK